MTTKEKTMRVNGATRSELLSLPDRDWRDEAQLYDSILVLSSGLKHDSGWARMVIVGCRDQSPVEVISRCSDDISWHITHPMRTDCGVPSRGIHFWSRGGRFRAGVAVSSIDIWLEPKE